MEFQPKDGKVRLIFGMELVRDGKPRDGLVHLRAAEELSENDPNVYYNLGLAYFDLSDFDEALKYARKAYALGFPLPGLRDKLKRTGKWREE